MSEAMFAAVNNALALSDTLDGSDSDTAAGGTTSASITGAPKTEIEEQGRREMLASPFFHYRNFSGVEDPDPLAPLTFPGRVPNFPAKMFAILSRPDLADIVAWMPHGRSWRILKPREFEIRVIPTYFEHSKYSSFIRQSNGWGFRRVTQGPDRNTYYHEQFLRGVPHLCKEMKRPGVKQKKTGNPEEEPNFYRISQLHPLPETAVDDSILLQCTIQGGPKARMPIYTGSLSSVASYSLVPLTSTTATVTSAIPNQTAYFQPVTVAPTQTQAFKMSPALTSMPPTSSPIFAAITLPPTSAVAGAVAMAMGDPTVATTSPTPMVFPGFPPIVAPTASGTTSPTPVIFPGFPPIEAPAAGTTSPAPVAFPTAAAPTISPTPMALPGFPPMMTPSAAGTTSPTSMSFPGFPPIPPGMDPAAAAQFAAGFALAAAYSQQHFMSQMMAQMNAGK